MRFRIVQRLAAVALCAGLVFGTSAYGDETEEIKLRIQEIMKQVGQLHREGLHEKAQGLIREQQELMQKLHRLQVESQFKKQGPAPEQMEKIQRTMERVNHLRIASEHLKMAEMHDMAQDLMRRAEDIEQDLRNAKEKMAQQQMRQAKESPSRDSQHRIREGRGPGDRGPGDRGPEARINGIEKQIEQLRAENQKLRSMVEKIADSLRRTERVEKPKAESDKPALEKPTFDKSRLDERMMEFAKRSIQRADKDGNGVLTPDEFKDNGKASFKEVDTNKDGTIDFEEYARYRSNL